MKKNDISALHEMSKEELLKKLEELEKQLHELWIQLANRKLSNTSSVGVLKSDIARVKTIITQKELVKKTKQIKE